MLRNTGAPNNHHLFLASTFITFIGNGCSYIVCGKMSYDAFGLASVFGVLLLLEQLKRVLMSSLGGYLSDIYFPGTIMAVADFLSCAVILVLVYISLQTNSMFASVGVLFFVNLIKPIRSPAAFAMVRRMTADTELFRVNNLVNFAVQGGFFTGLAITAALIQTCPGHVLLIVDAATYLVSGLILLWINIPEMNGAGTFLQRKRRMPRPGVDTNAFLSAVRNRRVLLIASLVIGIQLNTILMYNTALFKFISHNYPLNAEYLAVLEIIFTVSVLTFSFFMARRKVSAVTGNPMLWLVFVVQGLDLLAFALTDNIWLICLSVLVFGACNVLIGPVVVSILQKNTPVEISGKIGGFKDLVGGLVSVPLLLAVSYTLDNVSLAASYSLIAGLNILGGGILGYMLIQSAKQ